MERVEYTRRLCRVLAVLLPQNMEGSVTTLAISYKPWFKEQPYKIKTVLKHAASYISMVVEDMLHIRRETGKVLHLDLRPEPDGLLESTQEVIGFFQKYLIPHGTEYLVKHLKMSPAIAEESIRTHVRLCYDTAHFSMGSESHEEAFRRLKKENIRIGKVQISSSLRVRFSEDEAGNRQMLERLRGLEEQHYLHQVLSKDGSDRLIQYPDVDEAFKAYHREVKEWRIHYHVPVFKEKLNGLATMQPEILEVLKLVRKHKITQHLEIETYPLEAGSEGIQEAVASMQKELQWVLKALEVKNKIKTVK